MTISRTNIVLAALLVGVMMLAATTPIDYSRPNIEILPDMKYTPAWTTYAKNPNFTNGRTLQAPVPGTIARGDKPLHYVSTPEDAVRAGEDLQNPYDVDTSEAKGPNDTADDSRSDPASSDNEHADKDAQAAELLRQSVQRGGDVFRVFCLPCHGPTGGGDGPVAQRGFPPPPSLLTGKSPQMKDGQLFHILTYGQGSMLPMAAQLSPARRWDVINYVRSLQISVPANGSSESTAQDSPSQPSVATGVPETTPDSKGNDNDQ
jgi:mono/diheme cytochrome c family protein